MMSDIRMPFSLRLDPETEAKIAPAGVTLMFDGFRSR